jgi:hypothetical protein
MDGHQVGAGDGARSQKHASEVLDGILKGLADSPQDRFKILSRWLDRHVDDWAIILSEKVRGSSPQ